MHSVTRRHALGLGIVAGTTAVAAALESAYAAERTSDQTSNQLAGLRFRLNPAYKPELSAKAKKQLAGAAYNFMLASHPQGTTLSMWDRDPRDLPFLEDHLLQVVSAVFAGAERNLPGQPVDPVLIMAMLYNESRFLPVAVSPAGALGMAQFMPETAVEFGLNPIARMEIWERYRALRKSEGERRAGQRQAFLARFSVREFSAAAAIEQTLAAGDLAVLQAYQELATAVKPEAALLEEYVATVRADLAELDFFDGGAVRMTALDGRAGYAAVSAAVDYVAASLRENSGMTSSAVASYNAGLGAVKESNPASVLYGYGNLPGYAETVRYVQRVMVVYTKLQERLE